MIKKTALAFASDVEVVMWHTFVSKHDGKDNWGGYGVIPKDRINGGDESRDNDRDKYKSYYVYELLTQKIGNFKEVSTIVSNGISMLNPSPFETNGTYMYRFSGSLYPN